MSTPWSAAAQQQSGGHLSPLHPQVTGAPNPFRQSMIPSNDRYAIAVDGASPISQLCQPRRSPRRCRFRSRQTFDSAANGFEEPIGSPTRVGAEEGSRRTITLRAVTTTQRHRPIRLDGNLAASKKQSSTQASQHPASGGFISELASAFAVGGGPSGSQPSNGLENFAGLSISGGDSRVANERERLPLRQRSGTPPPPVPSSLRQRDMREAASNRSNLRRGRASYNHNRLDLRVVPSNHFNLIPRSNRNRRGLPAAPSSHSSLIHLPSCNRKRRDSLGPPSDHSSRLPTLARSSWDSLPPLPASPMQSPSTETPPPLPPIQTDFNPFGPASPNNQATHPSGSQNANFMQAFGISH